MPISAFFLKKDLWQGRSEWRGRLCERASALSFAEVRCMHRRGNVKSSNEAPQKITFECLAWEINCKDLKIGFLDQPLKYSSIIDQFLKKKPFPFPHLNKYSNPKLLSLLQPILLSVQPPPLKPISSVWKGLVGSVVNPHMGGGGLTFSPAVAVVKEISFGTERCGMKNLTWKKAGSALPTPTHSDKIKKCQNETRDNLV